MFIALSIPRFNKTKTFSTLEHVIYIVLSIHIILCFYEINYYKIAITTRNIICMTPQIVQFVNLVCYSFS